MTKGQKQQDAFDKRATALRNNLKRRKSKAQTDDKHTNEEKTDGTAQHTS